MKDKLIYLFTKQRSSEIVDRLIERRGEIQRQSKLSDAELKAIVMESDDVICFRTAVAEINRRRLAA